MTSQPLRHEGWYDMTVVIHIQAWETMEGP